VACQVLWLDQLVPPNASLLAARLFSGAYGAVERKGGAGMVHEREQLVDGTQEALVQGLLHADHVFQSSPRELPGGEPSMRC